MSDKNQFTLDTKGTGWKANVRKAVLGGIDNATFNIFDADQRGAAGFQLDLNKRTEFNNQINKEVLGSNSSVGGVYNKDGSLKKTVNGKPIVNAEGWTEGDTKNWLTTGQKPSKTSNQFKFLKYNRRIPRRAKPSKLPNNLRYPHSTIDDTQDFLRFSIFEYKRSGVITRGSSVKQEQNNLKSKSLGNIILPIPAQLVDANATNYGPGNMNFVTGGLLEGSRNLIEGDFTGAGDEAKNLLGGLISNQNAAKNWFAAKAVNALIGGNLTFDQILARSQAEIVNPNMELLFSGPTLRNFSFNFKLTPRYEQEAKVIRTIIKAFKRNMAPKGASGDYLKSPNIFEIQYLGKARNYLNRMKLCALTNISVNYTGDGNFTTYQDGAPISSMMTLSFTELTPVYNEDYEAYDDDSDGVGY